MSGGVMWSAVAQGAAGDHDTALAKVVATPLATFAGE
jgi:hypothetical protein